MVSNKQLDGILDRAKRVPGGSFIAADVLRHPSTRTHYLVIYRAERGTDFPVSREAVKFCVDLWGEEGGEFVVALDDDKSVAAQSTLGWLLATLYGVEPVTGPHGPYNWINSSWKVVKGHSSRRRGVV